jgi:hypothetical protein
MPTTTPKALCSAALVSTLAVISASSFSCAKSASERSSSSTEVGATASGSSPTEAPAADPAALAPRSETSPTGGAAASPARGKESGATAGDDAVASRPTQGEHDGRAQRQATAGRLTAGEWDDNLNPEFFGSYLSAMRRGRPDLPSVVVEDRVTIRVADERGRPAPGARVTVRSGDRVCLDAPTGADGRLLFFPSHDCGDQRDRFTVSASLSRQDAGTVQPAPRGDTWNLAVPGTAALPRALDLALLIDATGSMGDEISYLQEEVRGIVESVRAASPGVSLRFSLVVYRDRDDEYVTRVFPFTDDLDAFRRDLAAQSADGGGDYPEALDKGIEALGQLAWRAGDVAKVAFLIADAPPHTDRAAAYLAGVDALRRRGVHIYPVGASGVADEAEYLLRLTAALTQGRYLFLTDDSGVGNSHAEPHIPCYAVQKLDDLLRRMVLFELTGEPTAARDVVRTVGQPSAEGRCELTGGRVVQMAM